MKNLLKIIKYYLIPRAEFEEAKIKLKKYTAPELRKIPRKKKRKFEFRISNRKSRLRNM